MKDQWGLGLFQEWKLEIMGMEMEMEIDVQQVPNIRFENTEMFQ